MSILCATSYFQTNGKIPNIIKKLDQLLIKQHDKKIFVENTEFANYINNLCIKYGFLHACKDYLKKSIHGDQPQTNFFLSNFIYDSKAFLDSSCMLLNYYYDLKLKGGDIDFRKDLFLRKLKEIQPNIASELQKQQKWICDVIKYRDQVIHRSSIASIIFSPPDETGKRPKDNIVRMNSKFYSIFDLIRRTGVKESMTSYDIISFCDNWLKQAQIMFAMLLSFVEKDYRNGIRPNVGDK